MAVDILLVNSIFLDLDEDISPSTPAAGEEEIVEPIEPLDVEATSMEADVAELADLERPLLRRLSTEAPGTFEHTLMICGLAEEGGRAIQADT